MKASSSKASKTVRQAPSPSNKASKRPRVAIDSLQWRSLAAEGPMLDAGGGMMMLEEADGVDVQWEEDASGRKVAVLVEAVPSKKRKIRHETSDGTETPAATVGEENSDEYMRESAPAETSDQNSGGDKAQPKTKSKPSKKKKSKGEATAVKSETTDAVMPKIEEITFDDDLMPEWKDLSLAPALKRGLWGLGFTKPTEIQKRAVPFAMDGRDVVGVAETGSGKTLAYGLPILHRLLSGPPPPPTGRRPLQALILCPTRELALQVTKHLSTLVNTGLGISKPTVTSDDILIKEESSPPPPSLVAKPKGPPRISIISIVGGLSILKQRRLVERGADILVATPGRLWELCGEDEVLRCQIKRVGFLVVDEADRMIETGHFMELEKIVGLVARPEEGSTTVNVNAPEDDPTFLSATREADTVPVREDVQTFVFSATLSKELQANLKRGARRGGRRKKEDKGSTLDDLMDKLDFRDEQPEVINLSPEGGLVATLRECIVECLASEKDLYLYYFLLRYPGRSLVFVGSIDGIRRLVPLFETLKVPVFPLHSQLQQKQRLKNLDRFASSKTGVLIATDVAARGLDIPSVDHVIHFQLPRTADAYIHRSGRTARAKRDGFSLQMCSPEEMGMQKALMKSLGRTAELPDLQIEPGFLPKLKERVHIAKSIEKAAHHAKKDKHDKNWLKEAAEAMDIDIDPDMLSDKDSDDEAPRRTNKKVPSDAKLAGLRAELDSLLQQQLMARGVSAKYPTSGSRVVIDDLMTNSSHPSMLGASTAKAHEDIDASRSTKKTRRFVGKRPPRK